MRLNKVLLLIWFAMSLHDIASAQSPVIKSDSTKKVVVKSGNITKDLNALERQNIESLNLKQPTPANYLPRKTDTVQSEDFSTMPIVKGAAKKKSADKVPVAPKIQIPSKAADSAVVKQKIESKLNTADSIKVKPKAESKLKITDSVKVKQKLVDSIKVMLNKEDKVIVKPESKTKIEVKQKSLDTLKALLKSDQVLKKEDKIMPPVVKQVEKRDVPVAPVIAPKPKDDFSTQPIVKGKKATPLDEVPSSTEVAPVKKFSIDTSKGFKDFTFETTPVVNKNATYNRRSEPLPKTKEQTEEEIPVNRKSASGAIEKDNSVVKETYAQYNKEADSIRLANKRVLDSVMKALKIKVPVIVNPSDYIDIYVSGGGLIQNDNAKLYDHISILHTGVVQREYKSKAEGIQRMEKKISKDELVKLAQYIVDLDFMDMERDYDCQDADNLCNTRLMQSPQPIPLEITATIGDKKNKVQVSIFAPKAEKNWVNYPSNLEKIMNAILAITEK
jgi:hypothetical protein